MKYTKEYISDLHKIQEVIPDLSLIRNSKILITGAGGLICSAIIDFIMQYNDSCDAKIQFYIAARNVSNIKERFGTRFQRDDFNYFKYDATKPLMVEEEFDYIIHGASNANPAKYVEQPVETMLANFIGINNLLEYAKNHHAKRVLYISSSEVYGKKDDGTPYHEDDYEFVDILNPRACYPSAKRASETLCVAYGKEYGIETVIVRPGHIYGPTATTTDNRASSQFLRDVISGHDIIMKSMGLQIRSYCYVLDCVSAIITTLINGEPSNAYNISNPNSVTTICQLAECFAKLGGKKVVFEVPTEIEKASYNLMDNSSLDSKRLEALGWRGLFDLEQGVTSTLNFFRRIT